MSLLPGHWTWGSQGLGLSPFLDWESGSDFSLTFSRLSYTG